MPSLTLEKNVVKVSTGGVPLYVSTPPFGYGVATVLTNVPFL